MQGTCHETSKNDQVRHELSSSSVDSVQLVKTSHQLQRTLSHYISLSCPTLQFRPMSLIWDVCMINNSLFVAENTKKTITKVRNRSRKYGNSPRMFWNWHLSSNFVFWPQFFTPLFKTVIRPFCFVPDFLASSAWNSSFEFKNYVRKNPRHSQVMLKFHFRIEVFLHMFPCSICCCENGV